MAYTTGSLILDDDYNIFATGNAAGTGDDSVANLNTVWADTAGTGDKGYGQSSAVSAVSAGSTITATQWETLVSRLETIGAHQGTSINGGSGYSTVTAGDTISVLSNLSTDVSSIFSNRMNAAASGTDITTNGTTTTTSSWDVSAVTQKTVTFADADSARYFFNGGGMIRMSFGRSGGTTSNKNSEWTDLLNTKTGTIVFTAGTGTQTIASTSYTGTTKIGGGGTASTLATTTGFYDLTAGGAAVTIFKQFADTSPYTTNYIEITVALNAASTVLTFTVTCKDDATDTVAPDGSGSGDSLDVVNGTLTMTTVVRPPSTTYLTNTWGTPSMNSASWTLSS